MKRQREEKIPLVFPLKKVQKKSELYSPEAKCYRCLMKILAKIVDTPQFQLGPEPPEERVFNKIEAEVKILYDKLKAEYKAEGDAYEEQVDAEFRALGYIP